MPHQQMPNWKLELCNIIHLGILDGLMAHSFATHPDCRYQVNQTFRAAEEKVKEETTRVLRIGRGEKKAKSSHRSVSVANHQRRAMPEPQAGNRGSR